MKCVPRFALKNICDFVIPCSNPDLNQIAKFTVHKMFAKFLSIVLSNSLLVIVAQRYGVYIFNRLSSL